MIVSTAFAHPDRFIGRVEVLHEDLVRIVHERLRFLGGQHGNLARSQVDVGDVLRLGLLGRCLPCIHQLASALAAHGGHLAAAQTSLA